MNLACCEEKVASSEDDVGESIFNSKEIIRTDVVSNNSELSSNDRGVSIDRCEPYITLSLSVINSAIINIELSSILSEISIPSEISSSVSVENDNVAIPSIDAYSTPSKIRKERPELIFSTPKKEFCTDASCLCSICLSPLLLRTAVVQTRCKHHFHEKCLEAAKYRKAECPNCRTLLTPLRPAQQDGSLLLPDQIFGFRNLVYNRISSAREAVRLATVRREHERLRPPAVTVI